MTTERSPSTRELPGAVTTRLTNLVPRYSVILHNDDVNDMNYVVESLLKSVPPLTAERAREVMREAHDRGQAVVITCPFEQAELYRDRLQSCGLTATLEKA